MLRAVPPGLPAIVWSQRRTPLPCTAHGIGAGVAVNTLVIAASADGVNPISAHAVTAAIDQRTNAQLRAASVMLLLSRFPPNATEASRFGRP